MMPHTQKAVQGHRLSSVAMPTALRVAPGQQKAMAMAAVALLPGRLIHMAAEQVQEQARPGGHDASHTENNIRV